MTTSANTVTATDRASRALDVIATAANYAPPEQVAAAIDDLLDETGGPAQALGAVIGVATILADRLGIAASATGNHDSHNDARDAVLDTIRQQLEHEAVVATAVEQLDTWPL